MTPPYELCKASRQERAKIDNLSRAKRLRIVPTTTVKLIRILDNSLLLLAEARSLRPESTRRSVMRRVI